MIFFVGIHFGLLIDCFETPNTLNKFQFSNFNWLKSCFPFYLQFPHWKFQSWKIQLHIVVLIVTFIRFNVWNRFFVFVFVFNWLTIYAPIMKYCKLFLIERILLWNRTVYTINVNGQLSFRLNSWIDDNYMKYFCFTIISL